MSHPHDAGTDLCARVFDRLVEGADLGGDRALSEHLGSCVTCFRAMTELRDAPRVAEALRAEGPAVPRADDQFWDQLAARTTAAAEAALRGGAEPHAAPAKPRAGRSFSGGGVARATRVRIVSVAATLAAAAAAFLLIARHPLPPAPGELSADHQVSGPPEVASRAGGDEVFTDTEADVADLDVGALRRLLDRMRPTAPVALTSAAGGSGDAAELLGEDEGRMNDELADLDGTELRRVAGSLEAGAW